MVAAGQKWLYLDKNVVFGQSGCNLAKMWYSGKSGCIRGKVDIILQSGFNIAKWLYSGKVIVFGQNWLY